MLVHNGHLLHQSGHGHTLPAGKVNNITIDKCRKTGVVFEVGFSPIVIERWLGCSASCGQLGGTSEADG